MSTATEKPHRADAVRNRERVLDAARSCFADKGLGVHMEELARCAGVGVGTVYRHFETKEALVEALADEYFERLAEEARGALEDPDPLEAFEGFMRQAAETGANNVCIQQIMPGSVAGAAAERAGLLESVGELIARGQAAGLLREDLSVDDIPMIMCGLGRVQQVPAHARYADWRRHLRIVLDGLRAERPKARAAPAGRGAGRARR